MATKIAVILAAVWAAPAMAAPTYLTCVVDQGATESTVEITVDESEQRATVYLPATGRMVTRKALFSPKDVTIPDDASTWSINRVDLTMRRTYNFGEQSSDPGKCALMPAPAKRAF